MPRGGGWLTNGQMTKEFVLYRTDRTAWAREVAPRRARMLEEEQDPKLKREMWESFGVYSQRAIRAFKRQQEGEQ